jgi:hypothetical protein
MDDAEAKARAEEKRALQVQVLRTDAERARAEYTVAIEWIRELTGLPMAEVNARVAARLARKGAHDP